MKYLVCLVVFIINLFEGGGVEWVMVKLLIIMEFYFEEKMIFVYFIFLDDFFEFY